MALSEKKQKVTISSSIKRFGPSENSNTMTKGAGFSEKAKRGKTF